MATLTEWIQKTTFNGKLVLTIAIVAVYNAVLAWAVINSKMTIQEYTVAVGPMVSLVLGAWFVDRDKVEEPKEPTK